MNDDDRKHLEMLQAVINRMASNSFMLKSWSVTAATALLAFAAGAKHHWVAPVALLPTVVFWALDGYYTAHERRFRGLYYDVARVQPPTGTLSQVAPSVYDMNVQRYVTTFPWWRAVWSKSVWPVHGVVAVTVTIIAIAVSQLSDEEKEPVHVKVNDTVSVNVISSVPLSGGAGVQSNRPPAKP